MFYLCTCIVGVSAVYKYKRMYTLRFDSSGAQNGGQELHFGGFKWGRHCCLRSIAHCAVARTQRIMHCMCTCTVCVHMH